MKKSIIVTSDLSGLGWSQNTDHKVLVARKYTGEFKDEKDKELYEGSGEGIADIFDLDKIMSKRDKMKDWNWIWDGNHNTKENEILRREGFRVIHGDKFSDRMEHDRDFGIKVAEQAGFDLPLYKQCNSKDEGIKFLDENRDLPFVYKPDDAPNYLTTVPKWDSPDKMNEKMKINIESLGYDKFILQEMKKGIEVNCEVFSVDGVPITAHCSLETKRVSSGDLGCMVGCSTDLCFTVPLDSEIVKRTVGRLFPLIKKLKRTGFSEVNCIIGEGSVYFIEYCWRPGYNFHPMYFQTLSKDHFLDVMDSMLSGTYEPNLNHGFGASVTLTTDHPHKGIVLDIPDRVMKNVHLFGGVKKNGILSQDGWINNNNEQMIVTGHGYTIKDAFEDVYSNIEKIDYQNIDYRDDGGECDYYNSPIKRYEALKAMNLI